MGGGRHTRRFGERVRRAAVRLLATALVVAGIGLCAYPALAEWSAGRRHAEVIAGHGAAVSTMRRNERESMLADAWAYNAALAGVGVGVPGFSSDGSDGSGDAGDTAGLDDSSSAVDGSGPSGSRAPADSSDVFDSAGASGPSGSQDGVSMLRRYGDLLDPNGDGVMGVLAIPKIDLALPIRHGVDDAALADGIGHMPGTALPIGGDGSRSVLAGHRGLPSAELFTRLDELATGDTFSVTVLGTARVYRVTDVRVVDPQLAGAPGSAVAVSDPLAPVPGRDLVTLVTCTPYGVNTHRLLVTGERAPDLETGNAADAGDGIDARPSTMRIPTSPDAWFRSGWAATLATGLTLGVAAIRAIVRAVSRRRGRARLTHRVHRIRRLRRDRRAHRT